MDIKEFSENMTGHLVPVLNARPGATHAFIPDPLPPKWEWPTELWPILLEARRALASLDGTGKHLPNPDILLQPLQNREAQLSSQLEGTFTDPQEQMLFQEEPRYPTSRSDPANAHREVWNYRRALRLRREGGMDLPLSLRLIRQLHQVLMDGVRGFDQTPGEFRTTQNQIGHPARFVPPPPQHLAEALDLFEKYMHSTDDMNSCNELVKAFLVHYQFETIHPFRDGNGRVGRLLLSLTIKEWCDLSEQWLYMSAFFEKNKKQYMDLMLSVSTQGAWEHWIRFCLEGVISQAEDTERRCDKLLNLHREFHRRLEGGSVRLSKLVDRLFLSPTITVNQYKRLFSVTYPTARSDLKKLESAGIVTRIEWEQIAYSSMPIFDVIYEDVVS